MRRRDAVDGEGRPRVMVTVEGRRERAALAVVRARLRRAGERVESALDASEWAGLTERLEVEIVAALSELDQAERALNEWLNSRRS